MDLLINPFTGSSYCIETFLKNNAVVEAAEKHVLLRVAMQIAIHAVEILSACLSLFLSVTFCVGTA